jgi:ribonuclease E
VEAAEPAAKPKRTRRKAAPAEEAASAEAPVPVATLVAAEEQPTAVNDAAEAEEAGEPRRGWWQRTFGN